MTLPILISVPHAGVRVPEPLTNYCRLTTEELMQDGDAGAAEIYAIQQHVARYVTTEVPRAIIDLNRAADDRSSDGVVKTWTIWQQPIYHRPPPANVFETLLQQYYWPYHQQLSSAVSPDIRLGIDCHTMLASGPPIGPDTGVPRPHICLGDLHGKTLPDGWMGQLAHAFQKAFPDCDISQNRPFSGGYITRTHAAEMPWVQLEMSRAPFLTNCEKRSCLLIALNDFIHHLPATRRDQGPFDR